MSDIYNFVGADQSFQAPSTELRTKLGQLEHNNTFWRNVAQILLHPRVPKILRDLYTKIRPKETKQIPDKIFKRFANYYKDDILLLEEIIGKDLNIWKTKVI